MITRIFIQVIAMCVVGWLLCDIHPAESYCWYSGIWHGIFLPINFVRSLMTYCIKPSFILLHIRYSIGYLEFPLFYLLFLEVIKDDKVLLYTIGNRFADMFNAYAIRLLYFDKIYISYCIWSYGL